MRYFGNPLEGGFVELAEFANVGDRGYGQGVAVGDFDNDGFERSVRRQRRPLVAVCEPG